MSSWIVLVVAGLLEVAFALCLKQSRGLTDVRMIVIGTLAMLGSLALLALAMRAIPAGAAYATWTGIGAIGTALAGIVWFGEAATALKLASLALILAGVVGLKLGAGP